MDSTAKLRRELTFEIAKLNGLQKTVDLTVDDPSTKAMATEIRKQAGVCLDLLDQYQLSMPGRMRSYSERGCQSLREDLRRTEMHLRDASGIFQRRVERSHRLPITDWWCDDAYSQDEDLASAGSGVSDKQQEVHPTSWIALSMALVDANNRQDLEALMGLVADDVEFKLAFEPLLTGKSAVRRQYELEWAENRSGVVSVSEVFEAEGRVALEIRVDSGPPSNVLYNGVVVHHWDDEGRLARYRLYVDEVTTAQHQ